MISDNDIELIKQLTEIPGLSGREKPVADFIYSKLISSGWEVSKDRLNNVLAKKSGIGPHIMFIAHIDEVGMMVRKITDDGFVLVHRVGGLNPVSVSGRKFDLWTGKGKVSAFCGTLPPHFAGKQPVPEIENLYLDVCAETRQEVHDLGIRVGDGITSNSEFEHIGHRICGKALDDRIGCFIMLKLIEMINNLGSVRNPVTMAFVSLEETMTLETAPVIRQCSPDIVIGIDGTLPFDTPDIPDKQCDITLGKGFSIKWMDAIRGKAAYYPDWNLMKVIIDFAEKNDISFQSEVVVGICNALSPVAFMNQGVSTVSFSIPIRYHHSGYEMADIRDIQSLLSFISNLFETEIFSQENQLW